MCAETERGRKQCAASGGVYFLYGRTQLIQTCKQEPLHRPSVTMQLSSLLTGPDSCSAHQWEQISSKTHANKSHCFHPAVRSSASARRRASPALRYGSLVAGEKERRTIFYSWNTQKPICGVEIILVSSTGCSLQAN